MIFWVEEDKFMNTPTLETERLILRKFTEEDIEALFLSLKTRKSINIYLGFLSKTLRKPRPFMKNDMRLNTGRRKPTLMLSV